jgi:small nuclear ribonucleoprotein
MTNERPIDVLNDAKGKQILIKLKDGTTISGELMALDLHINMSINRAEIQTNKDDWTTRVKTLFVRGDNILYVSPGD